MSIRCFYIPQGLIIGDVTNSATEETRIVVKNPALVIARQSDVILAPLLHLVEENQFEIDMKDIAFNTVFTPKRELVNHYNQLYGSGLVLTTSMPGS
jgi:hypothetical protein